MRASRAGRPREARGTRAGRARGLALLILSLILLSIIFLSPRSARPFFYIQKLPINRRAADVSPGANNVDWRSRLSLTKETRCEPRKDHFN